MNYSHPPRNSENKNICSPRNGNYNKNAMDKATLCVQFLKPQRQ